MHSCCGATQPALPSRLLVTASVAHVAMSAAEVVEGAYAVGASAPARQYQSAGAAVNEYDIARRHGASEVCRHHAELLESTCPVPR